MATLRMGFPILKIPPLRPNFPLFPIQKLNDMDRQHLPDSSYKRRQIMDILFIALPSNFYPLMTIRRGSENISGIIIVAIVQFSLIKRKPKNLRHCSV